MNNDSKQQHSDFEPTRNGEYIAGARDSHATPATGRTANIFAAAEARLIAAQQAVSEHVDRRMTSRFAPPVAGDDASHAADWATVQCPGVEGADRLARHLRDDFHTRQRRLAERLAENMQAIALGDIAHAIAVTDHVADAAAQALRPMRDVTPERSAQLAPHAGAAHGATVVDQVTIVREDDDPRGALKATT